MEHASGLVDWSRAQFALTAMYHWIFVPLTLGLSFIVAIMESIYVKTNDEWWKKTTQFWMTLFAINFALGLATGLIMEFEFGTNWSNYSWIVGDIFGAPLAIEGIMAFFMESTFFAVMFFGWNKVGKKTHLLATWLVAIGSNLSALWILVANGWMQHPVGMEFNPTTARSDMVSFWAVLFNPNAYSKFLHTISSGYVLSALFVIAVASWYLLKGRELKFAKRSIAVAATFGLAASLYMLATGDQSAHQVALDQPMKLASMEGIYNGKQDEGIVAVGLLNDKKHIGDTTTPTFDFKVEIPYALSVLGYHDMSAFVPGINDLVYGNEKYGIMSVVEKMEKGKAAVASLEAYKTAMAAHDSTAMESALVKFKQNREYLGYGYLKDPKQAVPNVPLVFYSFHTMVGLGTLFIALFFFVLYISMTSDISRHRWLLKLGVIALPFGYIASEAGWVVAEAGRQPWAIEGLLPVGMATSNIPTTNVMITFWLFAIVFTVLLFAEVNIMLKQIKIGPKEH
jgi:cytochrome bd ubiquinol oxidase subunit I